MSNETTWVLLSIQHRPNVLQPIADHAANRVYPIKGVVDCSGSLASPVLAEIEAERERHIAKGYNAAHDDQHDMLELAATAIDYLPTEDAGVATREGCVKAAAVLVAMIEKFDREAKVVLA